MARIKLAYIGGGSTRAPGTMASFLAQGESFAGSEVVLIDIDREHLAVVERLAQKMARAAGHDIRVTATTDRRRGLQDCDAVLTSFRPGGFEARALDGFALCTDYCFNTGPFLNPSWFAEFVTPSLTRLTRGLRDLGFYVIKHTDGNIMPILDQLLASGPHALHSLDPQGEVDIAEVKRLCGDQVCLMGNVHCGLLDSGADEQVIESTRYALRHGMPGGGYVFSTSNCVYTGMPLARYDLILDIWRREGNY